MAALPEPIHPRLLWNPDNVRDVAESVGVALPEEPLRILTQDVEYRIGQVVVEALRFMRAANRTTLTVQDVAQALKVLDVEPLYGYESTRPLRYGEASLGPGQPLFYIEDEEVDFEKMINAPLPKVPRDMSFTAHWLSVEGVQPSIPQNPTSAESASKELLPKGPGANPALVALAGNDNLSFRPSVKHVISKELILYFDKVQAALLDEDPDEEKLRLRAAALESVRADPGLHQLLPYFVNFITNQVTHRLDDTFVLRQTMELAHAIIQNPFLFLEPYASALSAPVLTCLLARRLGSGSGSSLAPSAAAPATANSVGAASDQHVAHDSVNGVSDSIVSAAFAPLREQYQLRELAASLLGTIARGYSKSNVLLRPKLTRTCLKYFLDPTRPAAVLFGAVLGLANAGGPEAVRVLVLPNLRSFDHGVLQPLRERVEALSGGGGGGGEAAIARVEYEALMGALVQVVRSILLAPGGLGDGGEGGRMLPPNGVNGGAGGLAAEAAKVSDFVGLALGAKFADIGSHALNRAILEAKDIE